MQTSKTLSQHQHVQSANVNASQKKSLVLGHAQACSVKTAVTLICAYNALIFPHLHYCWNVWNTNRHC